MKLNEEIITSERLKMMWISRLRVDKSKSFKYNIFYPESQRHTFQEKKSIKPWQKVKYSFAPLDPQVFLNAGMHWEKHFTKKVLVAVNNSPRCHVVCECKARHFNLKQGAIQAVLRLKEFIRQSEVDRNIS
jgi:hypothetical protein